MASGRRRRGGEESKSKKKTEHRSASPAGSSRKAKACKENTVASVSSKRKGSIGVKDAAGGVPAPGKRQEPPQHKRGYASSSTSRSRSRSTSPAPKEMASESDSFWAKQASAWVNNKTSEQGPTALMALIATQAAVQMASQADGNANANLNSVSGPSRGLPRLPGPGKEGPPGFDKLGPVTGGHSPVSPMGGPMGPMGGPMGGPVRPPQSNFNMGTGGPMPPAPSFQPPAPFKPSFLAGLGGFVPPCGLAQGALSSVPVTAPIPPSNATPLGSSSASSAVVPGTSLIFSARRIPMMGNCLVWRAVSFAR